MSTKAGKAREKVIKQTDSVQQLVCWWKMIKKDQVQANTLACCVARADGSYLFCWNQGSQVVGTSNMLFPLSE